MLRHVKSHHFPSKSSLVSTARSAISKFSSDRCPMMGASIGFYSAFSLAPTLLIVLAVAGWFFGEDAAKGRLFDQVKGILEPAAGGRGGAKASFPRGRGESDRERQVVIGRPELNSEAD